jgi:hypothetical protein
LNRFSYHSRTSAAKAVKIRDHPVPVGPYPFLLFFDPGHLCLANHPFRNTCLQLVPVQYRDVPVPVNPDIQKQVQILHMVLVHLKVPADVKEVSLQVALAVHHLPEDISFSGIVAGVGGRPGLEENLAHAAGAITYVFEDHMITASVKQVAEVRLIRLVEMAFDF